jgi:hypothetical protein
VDRLEGRTLLSFSPAVNYPAGGGYASPISVAVGDFNRDGKPDLVTANYEDNSVSVLLGNGDGTFRDRVDYTTGTKTFFVAVGDFNSDGKPDLAATNAGDNTVSILLGNGDGTFRAPAAYAAGASPYTVALGDFNGDGKSDLVTADIDGGTVSVLLGNGDGTFRSPTHFSAGTRPTCVEVGDFNGDGKSDLATSNFYDGSDTLSILLGNGDGTFRAPVTYDVGASPYTVAVGDFNGDGKPDLATADYYDNTARILLGNGDGTFRPGATYGVGVLPIHVAVGDFDGDGRLDLATANDHGYSVSVLQGNGDGTFQAPVNYDVGVYPRVVAVGDFNNDGRPDLATANSGSNTVSVLLNQPQVADTTPPTTTATLSGTASSPDWYTGPVTAVLSATDPDDDSATLVTTYSLDYGTTTTYDRAHPLVINGDGIHLLTYQSRDPAGNVEAVRTQLIRIGQAPLAKQFIVTNLNDNGDGSLRQAIDDSDNTPGANEIDFVIGLNGTITLTSGQLTIANNDVAIVGPGESVVTVSGNNVGAVLDVASNVTASLTGLTISSGKTYSEGGGIYNDGKLAISNSIIASSSAYRGGGILNNGTLLLTDSSVLGNSAIGYNGGGGGIYSRGTLTVTDCTVADNSTDWLGGGIVGVAGSTMTISGTDVIHNSGGAGAGGICTDCKTQNTLTNSTVAYNSAGGTGGGGIGIYGGWMTIVNSTIAYNTLDNPAGSGGGLYSERDGPLYTLYNTIVALNTGSASSGPATSDIAAIVSPSSGHNLVGTGGSGGLMNGSGGNLVGVPDPGLAPNLADNGGPTQTIALLPSSPAINAGDSTKAPPTDQRGFARVGTPDIGAFEFGGKSQGVVYSAAKDFSLASNPNGVWSYGYELSLGSGFQVHSATTNNASGVNGMEEWYSPQLSGNTTPLVGYNSNGSDELVYDTVIVPAHQVWMHPGAPTSGNALSVLRWTAPAAGTYQVAAAFRGDDFAYPTSTDVHVLQNGSSLFDGGVYVYGPATSFTGTVSVKAGDTIDFVVGLGSDGDYTGDSTGISATLTQLEGPPVDTTKPTTTATLSGTEGSPGWYVGPVMVALNATDPDDATSSLVTTASLDGGPTFTYDPAYPLRIIGDGVHTLTYQSRDPAGNVEALKTQVIRIGEAPPAGDLEWIRQFGGVGASDEEAHGVAARDGYVYVAGHTSGVLAGQISAGAQDVFVRKYDSAGNELWTRQFGTPADDETNGVAVDATGIYVAGYTYGAFPGQVNSGGADVFVRKYDFAGNVLWTRQLGGADDDFAGNVAAGPSGVYVVGTTRGALPGQPGQGSGNRDAFLLKYDTAGNLIWTRRRCSRPNQAA